MQKIEIEKTDDLWEIECYPVAVYKLANLLDEKLTPEEYCIRKNWYGIQITWASLYSFDNDYPNKVAIYNPYRFLNKDTDLEELKIEATCLNEVIVDFYINTTLNVEVEEIINMHKEKIKEKIEIFKLEGKLTGKLWEY